MRRRVPFPLLALCLTAALVGITWAFVTPPFQAPDENQHFAYSDYVARTGTLPGDQLRPSFSTEQREAGLASNSDQVAGSIATDPSWDPFDEHAWARRERELGAAQREDGGGFYPATKNPPLYYLVDALPVKAAVNANIFTRLTVARLGSVVFTVLLVLFAWLLAGEVFTRDRVSQFLAAGFAGLLPMVQFVSSSVTPDSMLYATWAAFLWTGARVLKRGLTPARAAPLIVVAGVAIAVKATSYALAPGVVFVLAVGLWRLHPLGRRVLYGLAAGAALVTVAGVWVFLQRKSDPATAGPGGPFRLHDFLAYLWQYYLPRVPGQGRYPFPSYVKGLPFYDVTLRGIFGAFGWTEVRFAAGVYAALTAVAGIVAAGAIVALVRLRRAVDPALLAFFALCALALLAGVQWTDYTKLKESNFTAAFSQGRYFFPLAALAGLTVATAARLVPRPARGAVAAAFVSGLVVFNVYSLGVVAWRFYA
ncbi:MAG: hypothetical protein JWM73_1905 [Solirubrobacterales bacterium]|nr:hypothetical protein [Solirubrobacterales bacterium]